MRTKVTTLGNSQNTRNFSEACLLKLRSELLLIKLGIDVLHLNHLGPYWPTLHSPSHEAQWNQNIRPPHGKSKGQCPDTEHRIAVSVLQEPQVRRAGMATGYGMNDRGGKNFLFSTASRPALGSTQSPIQWVPGPLSPG
jgi:hypothetical protein